MATPESERLNEMMNNLRKVTEPPEVNTIGNVWVIVTRGIILNSMLCFPTKEICESYCILPEDIAFEMSMIDTPRD